MSRSKNRNPFADRSERPVIKMATLRISVNADGEIHTVKTTYAVNQTSRANLALKVLDLSKRLSKFVAFDPGTTP